MKYLKNLLLAGLFSTATLISSTATKKAEVPGLRYVMSNVEKMLTDSFAQLENAFADEQGGKSLSGETDFVKEIEISDDDKYMMMIKLSDGPEVSRQVKNKMILLVPFIEEGASHITSYACLTDMDKNYKPFKGAKELPESKVSRLSYSVNDPVLRKCLYYDTAKVQQMYDTGTMQTV